MAREPDIKLWEATALPTTVEQARRLAPMLKAVADENRLTLMLLLAERPRTVRELTDTTGMRQTLVSHHLTPLRDQGMVTATPRGRSNVYSLCCAGLVEPVRLLASLAAAPPAGWDRATAGDPDAAPPAGQ